MTSPSDDRPAGMDHPEELAPELLADLRQAWADLPTVPATPELDQADAQTRQVVSWMADAWAALPAPTVEPPLAAHARLARHRRRRHLAARTWTRQLAAAAVLLGLGLALWSVPSSTAPDHDRTARLSGPDGSPPRDPTSPGSEHAPGELAGNARPIPAAVPDTADTAARGLPPSPGTTAALGAARPADLSQPTDATPIAAGRHVISAGPDHLELRSGPVRLVLVTTPREPELPPR